MKIFKKNCPLKWQDMTSIRCFGVSLGPGLRPGYRLIKYVFSNQSENNELDLLSERLRYSYLRLLLMLSLFLILTGFIFGVFLGVSLLGRIYQ